MMNLPVQQFKYSKYIIRQVLKNVLNTLPKAQEFLTGGTFSKRERPELA